MKEYHQAVLLKASGNPILVGYECRPHTIPVKQSTPRIFNGEVVPPGATHYVYKYGHLSFVTYVEGVPYWNSVESYDRTNQTLTMPQVGSILHQDIKSLPEQENIMKKDFSKADLRTGMKVVLRNEMKYIVMLDVNGEDLFTNRDFGLMRFYTYQENLTCKPELICNNRDWDIVEVYRAHNNSLALDTESLGNLLWKREEKSPEQIAYEQLQAQIADEETRHNESMKALCEQAEKLKPKV